MKRLIIQMEPQIIFKIETSLSHKALLSLTHMKNLETPLYSTTLLRM